MEVEINPTQKELLAIIGCMWRELDELREKVAAAPVRFNKRTFSNHDIVDGHALGIRAKVLRDGKIVISTDS